MATTDFTSGVTLSDAGWADDIDCAGYAMLTGVGGTANAITATGPATYSLSATRPPVWFIAASTNTAATTITITPSGGAALTTKNVFSGNAACTGGELVAGRLYGIAYDGTQYQILQSPTKKVSVYVYTAWDPTDVAGTLTNAAATAASTSAAAAYITVSNSSGTTTWTSVIPGTYRFTISGQNEFNAAITAANFEVVTGGTGTIHLGTATLKIFSFVSGALQPMSGTGVFYASMTAGQTVTILPKFSVTSGGVTTNFTQQCTVAAEYAGA